MRGLLAAALAFGTWVVPTPQGPALPSNGAVKNGNPAVNQLAGDARKNQQSAEAEAIKATLPAIKQIQQQQAEAQKTEASEKRQTVNVEWWLVGVGVVQAIALILTIWAMIRQGVGVTVDGSLKHHLVARIAYLRPPSEVQRFSTRRCL